MSNKMVNTARKHGPYTVTLNFSDGSKRERQFDTLLEARTEYWQASRNLLMKMAGASVSMADVSGQEVLL